MLALLKLLNVSCSGYLGALLRLPNAACTSCKEAALLARVEWEVAGNRVKAVTVGLQDV